MKTSFLSIVLVLCATCASADNAPTPRLEFSSRFDSEVKRAVEHIQKNSTPKTHGTDFKMMLDKITAELESVLTFEGVDFFLAKADHATRSLDGKTTHRSLTTKIVSETNLLDKATIDARLDCYDALKASTKKVKATLDYAVKQTNDPNNLDHLKKRLIKIDKLQKLIVDARTVFLSYDVVSPTIALAQYRVQKDREHFTRIREHLNSVSSRIHMSFIYESNEDVRQKQFLTLMRYAKDKVSEKQWDDIITETTLTDSIDKSKARGGDGWWDK